MLFAATQDCLTRLKILIQELPWIEPSRIDLQINVKWKNGFQNIQERQWRFDVFWGNNRGRTLFISRSGDIFSWAFSDPEAEPQSGQDELKNFKNVWEIFVREN